MDVYTELHCICRDLVKKVEYLGTYGAKEQRRMIIQGSGIKQVVLRMENKSLNRALEEATQEWLKCGFESWKYDDTFLEKS